MKQRILHIITTIVTAVVVVTSLSLPVLAEEEAQLYVEYFPIESATMVVNGNSLSIYDLEIRTSNYYTTGSIPVASGYDQYIGARTATGNLIGLGYDDSNVNYYSLNLNYGDTWDYFDKSNINYISLEFCIVTPQGWSIDSLPDAFLNISRNGISLADRYSLTASFSGPVSATVNGTSYGYYRFVRCDVMFDSDLNFSQDDVIGFSLPYCPIVPFANTSGTYLSFYYNSGFNNLTVGYVTTNQYLDQISSSVNRINDKLDTTNETLTQISDQLSAELTDEQRETIDKITGKIEDSESKGEYIEDNINDLASQADENAYSFEADDFQTVINDNVSPVLDDEGFNGFFDGLFKNAWLTLTLPVVMFFVFIRYVIYGV